MGPKSLVIDIGNAGGDRDMVEKISIWGTEYEVTSLEKSKETCPVNVMPERSLTWPCRVEAISNGHFLIALRWASMPIRAWETRRGVLKTLVSGDGLRR